MHNKLVSNTNAHCTILVLRSLEFVHFIEEISVKK